MLVKREQTILSIKGKQSMIWKLLEKGEIDQINLLILTWADNNVGLISAKTDQTRLHSIIWRTMINNDDWKVE